MLNFNKSLMSYVMVMILDPSASFDSPLVKEHPRYNPTSVSGSILSLDLSRFSNLKMNFGRGRF